MEIERFFFTEVVRIINCHFAKMNEGRTSSSCEPREDCNNESEHDVGFQERWFFVFFSSRNQFVESAMI